MSRMQRRFVALVSLVFAFSIFGVVTPTVVKADSTPPLSWNAKVVGSIVGNMITDPLGRVTLPCNEDYRDLVTYDSSGVEIRHLSRTSTIDGVTNCIYNPVIDRTGTLYGVPYGEKPGGGYDYGPNLLAYDGNTLRWKYPVDCGAVSSTQVVGADGNIYLTTRYSDGTHLIGLDPELEPGKTSPKKVFDIKLRGDCSHELAAYKDGLIVYGQNVSSRAIYYSYTGKLLTSAPANVHVTFTATGKRINSSHVSISGGKLALVFSMFDPAKGRNTWIKTVSTPGANIKSTGRRGPIALPGDRVAVIFDEEEMIADNVPSGSGEYVKILAILGSDGQVIKRHILPSHDSEGASYSSLSLEATNTGFVVVRGVDKRASGWNNRIPEIAVSVFDAAGNNTGGGGILRGDTSDEATRYGYVVDGTIAVGNNTIFVPASCVGHCSFGPSEAKLFPVRATDIGMEYPRGDVITSSVQPQAQPKKYVALGDSFSSGEGVPPFIDGTNEPNQNECRQSFDAYPELLTRDAHVSAGLTKQSSFAACSGATAANVLNGGSGSGSWGGPPQVNNLSAETEVVTLTIGGNDIGFGDYLRACVLASCSEGSSAYTTIMNKINGSGFRASLKTTYETILNQDNAPNAQLYVADYPYITAADAGMCGVFDFSGGRTVQVALNSVIQSVVSEVKSNNNRIHYVATNYSGSPFTGKHYCNGGESFFNGYDTANPTYSFHPNERGQQAYASIFKSAIATS